MLRTRDVVALARRDRDEAHRLDAQALEIVAILLGHRAEAVGAVADQVHLVDQHRDLVDAQQMQQVAVAAGLLAHALVGVDQQQRGLAAAAPVTMFLRNSRWPGASMIT